MKKKEKATESYRMVILDVSESKPREYEYKPQPFQIWMEGYAAIGERSGAQFLGVVMAQSFQEACHIHYCESWLKTRQEAINSKEYHNYSRFDYDPIRLSIWGCGLFDNEADARKSFG